MAFHRAQDSVYHHQVSIVGCQTSQPGHSLPGQDAGIPFCHIATRKAGSRVWIKAKKLACYREFCGAKSRCKPSRENVR